jgi:3-hydroxyisobutyrate dehydrogenase-like beta-hydroxyacid dehydrogenase
MIGSVADVAVVGLGAMGARIAGRLLESGHRVTVWNRTRAKTTELAKRGASAAATPAEAAAHADAVITMVADPDALRAVTEDADGVASGIRTSATVIQMSTVGVAATLRLAALLDGRCGLLDAPVLGSVSEAESGTLTVFAGGDDAQFQRWQPLLSALGRPLHVGGIGAGSAAKLVANTTLFGVVGVLGEALALARALGLEEDAAFDVLAATPIAPQAERRRAAVESGTYPPRFSLALAHKDAELIREAASAAGVDLRVTEAARTWLADAQEAGLGEQDYSSVLEQILGRTKGPPEASRS